MLSYSKRHIFGILFVAVTLMVCGGYFLLRQPADIREYWSIKGDLAAAGQGADSESKNRLAIRCIDLAERYPGSVGGLSALLLASTHTPDVKVGGKVRQLLSEEFETANIKHITAAFDRSSGNWHGIEDLAPLLLVRTQEDPDHPKAAQLLAEICAITRPEEDGEPPEIFDEAADLIADLYPNSPDIHHLCEILGQRHGSPPWATRYERHLRTIVQANKDRKVRCAAQFSLASVVQAAAVNRQAEAEELFRQFCREFDGNHSYSYQNIEKALIHAAEEHLKELKFRASGKAAPEIVGIDLEGQPLKLSDYRGRVVLLNFWATWCFPCMKLVPHEREIAAEFQGDFFDIVGVNCDSDIKQANEAVVRTNMTWRSFRNEAIGEEPITKEWNILGYPTVYLIDHHGIIRKRWVGPPRTDVLKHMVGVLVDAAQQKLPRDGMQPVIAKLSMPLADTKPKASTSTTDVESPKHTGFLDEVYLSPEGTESKYVIFVPSEYDGKITFPAILYLHGAGSAGKDGRRQLQQGLAKTIREKRLDFNFIAIFPQAHENEGWTAESTGGQRALVILDEVQNKYRIDPDRISLTGVSMGGAGTWSLAAADPTRWASIVPVCHGGDTKAAVQLKDVPCWCFHGDADKVISVQRSREMIEAIRKAGGQPLYQEFPGVDHNRCADHVYSKNDLYEWILLQKTLNQ